MLFTNPKILPTHHVSPIHTKREKEKIFAAAFDKNERVTVNLEIVYNRK